MIGKQKASFFLASFLLPTFVISWLFFNPGASARLGLVKTETLIEIDGVNYGVINDINDLRDLTLSQKKDETFTRVSLKRDFVTEPSIFLWADQISQNRSKAIHMSVIIQTKDKVKIARYELNNCRPLSWTFERADPSQGGFHEKIDLAVQEIAID